MEYLKKFEQMTQMYNAAEIYITIVPLKHLTFDMVTEYTTEPFKLFDGSGRLTLEPMIEKVYVHILKIAKPSGTFDMTYHNHVRSWSYYDQKVDKEIGNVKSVSGDVKSADEYFWELIYDFDHKEVVVPTNFRVDRYIPEEVKKVFSYLVDKK